jgi:hypothetical protein
MNLKRKLLVFLLCSLLLAASGCNSLPAGGGGGSGTASQPGGAGGTSTGAGVISAGDKPLDAMLKAAHAQLDAKSYRAHVEMTMSNGATNTLHVEYAAPDRYHLSTQSQAAGRQTSIEYIIIGKDTWMKRNDAAWAKFPVDMSSMITAVRDPKMIDELAKSAEVRLVGPDTLDGTPTLVYEHTLSNVAGMNIKGTAKTWVAISDALPRKSESESEFNGMKSKSVATYSDFNSDIKIEPPTK